MSLIALLLALHLAAPADEPQHPQRGTLCLSDAAHAYPSDSCTAIQGLSLAVPPSGEDRPWSWHAADARTIALGVLPAGAESIDLASLRSVEVRLEGSKARGWPASTTLKWTLGEHAWSMTLEGEEAGALRTVLLGPGRHAMSVSAPRHIPLAALVIELPPDKERLVMGTLELAPAPMLLGSVSDQAGSPLSGVSVGTKDGKTLAFTDALGRVEVELEDVLPSQLVLSYPGLAPRTVLVTNTRSDFDFGNQVLSEGVTLEIEVAGLEEESAVVRIFADFREPGMAREVGDARVDASVPVAAFEQLEPGMYSVFLEGDQPWKRFGADVTVREGAANRERIEIERHEIEGIVKLGAHAMARATVRIGPPTYPGPPWQAELSTNDDGRFDATFWQSGTLTALMLAAEGSRPDSRLVWFEVPDTAHGTVEIIFPDGRIAGQVIDAASGQPLSGISVSHSYKTATTAGVSSLRSGRDGRFSVEGAIEGTHTFSISNPDYAPFSTSITITGVAEKREVMLALEKGLEARIVIVSDAAPQAGAHVIEITDQTGAVSTASPIYVRTDATGTARIPMREGERRSFFVLLPTGAFAFAEADATRGAPGEIVVSVPPVTGTLVVRTVDRDQPVPHLVVLEHDGRFLSTDLLDAIASVTGMSFRTGLDGTARFALPSGNVVVWAFEDRHGNLGVTRKPQQPGTLVAFTGGERTVTIESKGRNLRAQSRAETESRTK